MKPAWNARCAGLNSPRFRSKPVPHDRGSHLIAALAAGRTGAARDDDAPGVGAIAVHSAAGRTGAAAGQHEVGRGRDPGDRALRRDGAAINGGLHWRVYADKPDQTGVFRLLKEDTSPQPTFVLPAGNYIDPRRLRARQHGEAGADQQGDDARGVRYRRRRAFASKAGRQRQDSDRADFVRHLPGQPVRAGRPPADRFERADRRGRAGARGHLLHPVEVRRRQLGGALRHPRRSPASSPTSR